jgi:hypothetical protein
MAGGEHDDVRLVDPEDRDELLAEGALDRRQTRVALGETREPLHALQEPLHPGSVSLSSGRGADLQVIRAWAPPDRERTV